MKRDFFNETNAPKRLRRLLEIDQCLRKKQGMTKTEILEHLERHELKSSQRTFWRDIEHLRDLDAPINHKAHINAATGDTEERWFYNNPAWTFSRIPMTEGPLFALLVSQRVMQQFAGLPIAQELVRAFNEIADQFNRKIAVQQDTLVPISVSSEKSVPVDSTVWDQVTKAAMQHRRLRITYQKGWQNEAGKSATRNVAPYHIVNLQGTWYLLATASEKDNALRQYTLSRIKKATMLAHNFTIPPDFDIDRILSITFGQFIGDPNSIEEVHVRFDKKVAPLVMSRQFSSRERKDVLPNGDIDLRFPASAAGPLPFYHIKSWVLSWGADVKVLAPEALKDLVRDETVRMAEAIQN